MATMASPQYTFMTEDSRLLAIGAARSVLERAKSSEHTVAEAAQNRASVENSGTDSEFARWAATAEANVSRAALERMRGVAAFGSTGIFGHRGLLTSIHGDSYTTTDHAHETTLQDAYADPESTLVGPAGKELLAAWTEISEDVSTPGKSRSVGCNTEPVIIVSADVAEPPDSPLGTRTPPRRRSPPASAPRAARSPPRTPAAIHRPAFAQTLPPRPRSGGRSSLSQSLPPWRPACSPARAYHRIRNQ